LDEAFVNNPSSFRRLAAITVIISMTLVLDAFFYLLLLAPIWALWLGIVAARGAESSEVAA